MTIPADTSSVAISENSNPVTTTTPIGKSVHDVESQQSLSRNTLSDDDNVAIVHAKRWAMFMLVLLVIALVFQFYAIGNIQTYVYWSLVFIFCFMIASPVASLISFGCACGGGADVAAFYWTSKYNNLPAKAKNVARATFVITTINIVLPICNNVLFDPMFSYDTGEGTSSGFYAFAVIGIILTVSAIILTWLLIRALKSSQVGDAVAATDAEN